MNSKKLVSLIVLVAIIFVVVFITQNLGDKKYQRNEYKPPVIITESVDSRDDLEEQLASAQEDVSWQTFRLAILQAPLDLGKIKSQEIKVEKTKVVLKKALSDAYEVAKDVVAKNDIPFFRTEAEVVAKKKEIDKLLAIWKDSITNGHPPGASTVNDYLNSIHNYLTDLENLIQNLTPENSGLTDEQIDNYEETIQNSIAEVNNTISILTDAQSNVTKAEEELTTQQSAGNPQAIEQQTQIVIEAQAVVADIKEAIDNLPPPTNSPSTITIPDSTINPNIKVNPPFDPSQPHLRQD